ncbi:hypothetical protein OH492_27690 [Vibrio chagasii]|nr:hypothetical protein [Vibrio chagasii]
MTSAANQTLLNEFLNDGCGMPVALLCGNKTLSYGCKTPRSCANHAGISALMMARCAFLAIVSSDFIRQPCSKR